MEKYWETRRASTSAQQITEVVVVLQRALALHLASHVNVILDTKEMDSSVQVNLDVDNLVVALIPVSRFKCYLIR